MDLHLEGKVVILTGGFKGIGKGIALRLAKEGAIVAVINRDDGTAEQFDAEMKAITDNYRTYLMDLNDTDDIAPIVEDVVKTYGHIDGLVNNAGRNDNLDLDHTSWREFEQSLHGNLTHYYELAHRCAPYLRESKGAIVNISSKTALTGQGKTSAYAAAKGAILGLTREWAAAFAKDDVRVNAIVVSEAFTPLYAKWITTFGDEGAQREQLDKITSRIPLGHRMTSVEEIANEAAFLLSNCSSDTTGQWEYVDGGYVHLDRALA